MPLCRLAIRSLLRSRNPTCAFQTQHWSSRRPPICRNHSTAVRQRQQHDSADDLDLSKLSADSAYLDFILGGAPDRKEKKAGGSGSQDRRADYGGQVQENNGEERETSRPVEAHRRQDNASSSSVGDNRSRKLRSSAPRRLLGLRHSSDPRLRRTQTHEDYEVESKSDNLATGDGHVSSRGSRQQAKASAETASSPPVLHGMRHIRPAHLRYLASLKARNAAKANTNLFMLRARGERIRTKLVSLWPKDGEFSSEWNREFASLQRHYDKSFPDDYLKARQPARLDPHVEEWAEQALSAIKQGESSEINKHIGIRQGRSRRWQQIALWILHHQPTDMVDFLRATHTSPFPPMTYVRDSLQYLVTHFSHCESPVKSAQLSAIADAFPLLAQRTNGARFWMDGSFFRLLIAHCSDEQIVRLYKSIKEQHVRTSWLTYLQFSSYFAKNGHFEKGLDAILEAKSAKADLGSYAFRSTCATLLRSSIREPNGLRVCLRIVDNLVKIGLTLNNTLCNIVMLNAVEAGDLHTTFSIYRSLVQHGLEADAFTYAILLKGCKATIDDAETLNTTIRSAIDHVDILRHPILAAEILHCLALHHRKHQPNEAFGTVVDAYAQLFDLQPLNQLGVLLPKVSRPSHPAEKKLQPSPQVLGILLPIYLDHTLRISRSTLPAYEVYKRYRSLAGSGVEPFAPSLETDHIVNAFLMTFIQTKKGLLYAAEVVKDMQKSSEPGSFRKRCSPTVQTWSIFLHGFTQHGQMKLADQVLNYMRKRDIQPNQITWNILTAGYAGSQDLEGTLSSLRRMENDGQTWDDWTMSGVKRLKDQERLKEELKKRKRPAELDFTSELKQNLGAKITAVDDSREGEEKLSANTDVNTA